MNKPQNLRRRGSIHDRRDGGGRLWLGAPRGFLLTTDDTIMLDGMSQIWKERIGGEKDRPSQWNQVLKAIEEWWREQ
jgi:hypothetical protein